MWGQRPRREPERRPPQYMGNTNQQHVTAGMKRAARSMGEDTGEDTSLLLDRDRVVRTVDRLFQDNIEMNERCRRQQEEVEKASKSLKQKEELIAAFSQRINSLQYHPDALNDDEIVQIMSRLNQKLDIWVKANFPDPALLEKLAGLDLVNVPYGHRYVGKPGELQNIFDRWAYVQAFACSCVCQHIFDPYMLGLSDKNLENYLKRMESEVSKQCPPHVVGNWHSATGIAVTSLVKSSLDDIRTRCAQDIEKLSPCASTDPEERVSKLRDFLSDCMKFKRLLERQKSRYRFSHTYSGHEFIPGAMKSITGEEGDTATVKFSLWPGLLKDNSPVHLETVWSTEKTIKVKVEDSESALAWISNW